MSLLVEAVISCVRKREVSHACFGLLLKTCLVGGSSGGSSGGMAVSEMVDLCLWMIKEGHWKSFEYMVSELILTDVLMMRVGRAALFDLILHSVEVGVVVGDGSVADAPLKALMALVTSSTMKESSTGHCRAMVQRVYQSKSVNIHGKTKRCISMIKKFQLNMDDFKEVRVLGWWCMFLVLCFLFIFLLLTSFCLFISLSFLSLSLFSSRSLSSLSLLSPLLSLFSPLLSLFSPLLSLSVLSRLLLKERQQALNGCSQMDTTICSKAQLKILKR